MNRPIRFALALALAVSALPMLAAETPSEAPPAARAAFTAFRPEAIRAHTKFLSSDLLEGRGPGTRGDALATEYIASQLEAAGLQPAGDNGTFFQKVSLLGITLDPAHSQIAFAKNGVAGKPLVYRDEYAGGNQTQKKLEQLDSEVVFVGHGVVAPEYRWDDYKGFDPTGKTLVMLVDDPPATTEEPDLFKGIARTYYGRWTYKYETGATKKAQAVILIHTNAAAGYGWEVVRNSWGAEQAYVRNPEGQHALSFAGWLTETAARDLFKSAGLDLAQLTKAAASRDFKPVPLGVRLQGRITSAIRPFDTSNVVARVGGSDPQLKNEAVLYSAHHDHIGIGSADEDDPKDTIYNGAIDNASGTAAVLEIARVWARTEPRPKRSILFAFVAAEEQGLLGSEYFGLHPPVPAGNIVLGLNLDALSLLGEVKTVTMLGVDQTTFLPTAQQVTKAMNLEIVGDQAPEQGSYYRSDHFSLAKVGVPAFSIKQGAQVVGKPLEWSRERLKEYRDKHYHQASDEYDASWNFDAAVQVGQLAWWLGWEAANASSVPNWIEGAEFRAIRDESRK